MGKCKTGLRFGCFKEPEESSSSLFKNIRVSSRHDLLIKEAYEDLYYSDIIKSGFNIIEMIG